MTLRLRWLQVWLPRLTAVGFLIGMVTHGAIALFAIPSRRPMVFGSWHHPAFVLIDLGIALLALTRPRLLVFGLLVFLLEQAAAHGPAIWQKWQSQRRVEWPLMLVDGFIFVAMVGAARIRWARVEPETRTRRQTAEQSELVSPK